MNPSTENTFTKYLFEISFKMNVVLLFVIFVLCYGAVSEPFISQDLTAFKLGRLNLNRETVTLSGFSAGSSMATQFHIAHSSLFRGVGLFSQAYYRCGPNSLVEFGIRCSKLGSELFPYDVKYAIQDAKNYELKGVIDLLSSLKNQKVFIWTGYQDEYLSSSVVAENKIFYEKFVSNPNENIRLTVANATHLFPTDNYGVGCTENAEHSYYLGNCSYSGAKHALEFLLPDVFTTSSFNSEENGYLESQLKVFNQTEFYEGDGLISTIGMGSQGHIYIPKLCEDSRTQCQLHFNFHGCNEWPLDVARQYVLNNGFLPIAEKYGIVIVFPLTTAIPTNYNGCWDFFSYTGSNFATKNGQQIQVVHKMYQRLMNGI